MRQPKKSFCSYLNKFGHLGVFGVALFNMKSIGLRLCVCVRSLRVEVAKAGTEAAVATTSLQTHIRKDCCLVTLPLLIHSFRKPCRHAQLIAIMHTGISASQLLQRPARERSGRVEYKRHSQVVLLPSCASPESCFVNRA